MSQKYEKLICLGLIRISYVVTKIWVCVIWKSSHSVFIYVLHSIQTLMDLESFTTLITVDLI